MDSLASRVGSGDFDRHVPTPSSSSPALETYSYATDIIESLGRLTVGAGRSKREEIIRAIDTEGGSIYRPEALSIWGIKVLDRVPPAPLVALNKKQVLLYIPNMVLVNGKVENFTLNVLNGAYAYGSFGFFEATVREQFGDATAPGWVLIDKKLLSGSRGKDYETQKRMVEEKGCSMPRVLEAVLLNLIVFAFTGERLYGTGIYTCCMEKVDGESPVIVGNFDLRNRLFIENDRAGYGVACVQRF